MNIVLISMDCVRSDYFDPSDLGLKGKGLFHFPTCISTASHTSTSHTTMLTGTYPFEHGVRWLVKYRINDMMIQELLKENGFRTAAFIGGFPLTQGDMERGFDIFEHDPLVEDRSEGRSHFVPVNVLMQKTVNFLNDGDGDKFAFIHIFDAHFTLRSEFDVMNPPPEKDENGVYIDIEDHLGRRKRRYTEEIGFIRTQIERLQELANIDLLVITADHGEKMQGEKGYPWVKNHMGKNVGSHFHEVELYDVQLKVPLVFIGDGFGNGKSKKMVRTIDIAPTIIDHVGLGQEKMKFTGSSLKPLIREEGTVEIKDAYSETYFAQMNRSNKHATSMNERFAWGWKGIDNLISIRTDQHKLICLANGSPEPYMLFDIEEDPMEENDLIDRKEYQEIKMALYTRLQQLIRDDVQFKNDKVSDETMKLSSAIRKVKSKKVL